jgi:gluconolactonase
MRSAAPRVQGPFVIYSEEFVEVLGDDPSLEKLVETNAHEGPVYVRDQDALYFTTVPASIGVPLPGWKEVQIGRLDLASGEVSTFRAASNMANGMTLDREGRLLVCEQGTKTARARISRIDLESGETETLVDEWFGLTFNSPNDIVVKRDGTVWFTDPSYGYLQGFKDQPMVSDFVYRYDPATGDVTVVADSFNKPNGLAFSPDEKTLYINDSGAIQGPGSYYVNLPHHIRAFDVASDGGPLTNDRLFAVVTPGIPDGLKTDSAGRVYSSCSTGVKVYSPQARLLGEILVPGTANFCFGGAEDNRLFMLNDTAIWAVTLNARGNAPG